jgi:RNase adapter protein RapZ
VTEFVAVTGLSGAGRSEAANHLEDLGWFVIDNVPPSLIPKVGELAAGPSSHNERVALVVRTGDYATEIQPALEHLREFGRVRIIFLDAASDVLVRRYESTRRRHPLSEADSVVDAIESERAMLEPIKAQADVVIDTSDLNVHQLRQRVIGLFGAESPQTGLQTAIVSFGYKHGLPLDVDIVLDCRFLPNPHWVDELRPLAGTDPQVRDYVLGQPETGAFLERLDDLLALVLPAYVKEGKSYLSIALGCTGGRHRSVVIAEEVAGMLRRHGFEPTVTHRDVER